MHTTTIEPAWLIEARKSIGLRELPGAPTAPTIARWLQELGAWWSGDDVPWCGTAVAAWMTGAGVDPPKAWYRARAWLDWGVNITVPLLGAVVVFARAGGGHVGIIVGKDAAGRLMVLGGNQGNAVTVAPFDMARVLGYRWPANRLAELRTGVLPLLTASGASSRNEA